MNKYYAENFIELIGNTPLVKLQAASKATGSTILGKCEFMNPGGSVKDRAALAIIRAAERSGALKPAGLIVEGTAGNTGIGLSLVARALGYETLIVIPDNQSTEKKEMIRLAGATLIEVPPAPYKNPENYIHVSKRIAEEKRDEGNYSSVIWANQFDNTANRDGHYETTGKEIWNQTQGKIDGFICAVGSGGTLVGTSNFLKEQNSKVQIGIADPMGAALYHYYQHGSLQSDGSSITEGIGQGRITANLQGFTPDHAYQISDEEALNLLFDLSLNEGLCLGGSAGINVAGAIRLARTMGPGKTIVTILCDGGARYQSKLFNPEFLKSKNLPLPPWL
ncbi:MAG: cysteine synthase A [Alphaproteobacteria bacterium]